MTYDDFKKRYRYDPTSDILGEGAFGKVFRATDTESGSTVAIKVAPVNTANESHSLKHEFETVGRVEPHLHIALYDECYRFAVEWAGLHDFAVLEYYPLGSLDKILKNQHTGGNPLTDSEKHDLALGILEGLRHLHNTGAQGVVHRDLKPRNVLIQKWRGKYVPKITDFGLSKFSDSVSNSVISQSFKGGTLNYASPEQIKGEQIRRNTDLWSFGVILHELLTGEVPYKIDDSSESTLRQVYDRMNRQSLPDSFSKVNEPYATVIRKCLVVNPNQRYRTAEEVLKDIRQLPASPPPVVVAAPVTPEKPPIKDNTEIFDNNPFASFGQSFEPPAPPADAQPSFGEKPVQKDDLEGSGYVKSDPKPKKEPKKDWTLIIIGAVAVLGIITFAVIYMGGNREVIASDPKDSVTKGSKNPPEVVVDTALLAHQADSLFDWPNYTEYAHVILKINDAKSLNPNYQKSNVLQKLRDKAPQWEKDKAPEAQAMLKDIADAILILDPRDPKGLELREKLK